METHFSHHDGCVHALLQLLLSFYLLNTLYLNFLFWHLVLVWKNREFLTLSSPFFLEVEVLLMLAMLSGPAEYIYLVLGE